MNQVLRFNMNIPEEIALRDAEGRRVQGRYAKQANVLALRWLGLRTALWHTGVVAMRRTEVEAFQPPRADDPVVIEVVRRLAEVYRPLRIYLFGSAARGDAGPDSDYDFMVVVPDDSPRDRLDSGIGYQALWGIGLAKDILVWPKAEFDKRLHLKASLPSTIIREGKVLYAA